jgi:hypothetical protein
MGQTRQAVFISKHYPTIRLGEGGRGLTKITKNVSE